MMIANSARGGNVYIETNVISNGSVGALDTDPNLQGAWGLAFSTKSPFWIADQAVNDNGSGASTIYKVNDTSVPTMASTVPLVVAVPNQGGAPPSSDQSNGPTGIVSTGAAGISVGSSDFVVGNSSAAFIFANLDGSISGWNGGTHATIEANVAGASFTGLAIGNSSSGPMLYGADQTGGNIDMINNKWQMAGSFSDPNFSSMPSGYAVFNVQNLSVNGTQTIFVTYANQSTGGGIVDEFTTDGTFIKTLISDTTGVNLNAPYGMAIAPSGWGQFGGDLLVGNNNANADGLTEINAYNLSTGAFVGTLMLNNGPFSAEELWGMAFGNGAGSGSANTLFFAAGLDNNTNGLIGAISVPEPSSAVLGSIAVGFLAGGLTWKRARRA